jgi:two-component sensor histidine kinase
VCGSAGISDRDRFERCSGVTERFIVLLPLSSDTPSRARSCLSGMVDGRLTRDRGAIAELLVSELVTNSIQHSGLVRGQRLQLDADVNDDHLRVVVSDASGPFDPPSVGMGFALVDHLADHWGVARGDPNRVWFEIACVR